MFNDRDELAAYRRLEFPNETTRSWPIAERDRDQVVMPYLRVARDTRPADAEKKIAA